ncbi:cell division protein ZapA [Anaerofilum sp. BX8]|uniref:Cell division protein ZapA n=1 Tax=Anaerofilum hominis TaxID=2763016 RepID=A0A923IB69_9FIRM|nr:cell division protein ZapA [Anaerofilum hominis]MBC5581668.1 cell division protein ZapA [Anaerofilum hominis]
MPVNKIRLEICGGSYLISTTDSEQYTLSLAEKLDHNMNEIMAQNPSASVTAAAVLSALDYLDELEKSSASADNMRSQIKDYLEDAAKAKLEAEEAKKEIERLRREIGYLKGSAAGER